MLTNESPNSPGPTLDVEKAVRERYSAASQTVETRLCCSVRYDRSHLEAIPAEIVERDYGCGDPSRHVREGESVLDLGCGGGKICYIASQIVGPRGHVTGVDMNDGMLALARKYRDEVGRRIGWQNVEFRKARIQDLALDLEQLEGHLHESPIRTVADWLAMQRKIDELHSHAPMIPNNSIDVVLSNCVLNLVIPRDRDQLFREIFRVVRPGGRAVISDIVSDEPVPAYMQNDPHLWSGCISGAFVEHEFLAAFERTGFYGVEIVSRQDNPWAAVEGIEFRSVTVRAFKATDTNGENCSWNQKPGNSCCGSDERC